MRSRAFFTGGVNSPPLASSRAQPAYSGEHRPGDGPVTEMPHELPHVAIERVGQRRGAKNALIKPPSTTKAIAPVAIPATSGGTPALASTAAAVP